MASENSYPLWKKFLNSRKFWAFVLGLVTVLGSSFEDGVVVQQEVTAIVGLFIGYIFSVAFEDGMSREKH